MKKMNIALFTAAAMSASSFAVAQTGPDISGRIDMSITNLDNAETSFTDRSTVLAASGSSDLIGGLTGSYYLRGNYTNGDAVQADYSSFTVSGDFGDLTFGRADNVVYKFAGAHTDVYRSLGTTSKATYGEAGFQPGEALQYYTTVNALTIGAYVDTAAGNGTDNVQLGGLLDLGMGNVSLIYAENDVSSENETVFGASLDLDVVSVGGSYSDKFDGSNPVAVAATVPINSTFSVIAGYGDSDAGTTDTNVSVVANLGGGLDARVEYRNGDSTDGVALNARYSF